MKQKASKKRGGATNSVLRITRRLVNVRRHTTGYIIGGKRHSVLATSKLAKAGRISGVQVVGNHVQAIPGRRRLTDLPTEVVR